MLLIDLTNQPELLGKLQVLQASLTACEKTLAQYLETKRVSFPRFYFISTADLLDILSKGKQPKLITK